MDVVDHLLDGRDGVDGRVGEEVTTQLGESFKVLQSLAFVNATVENKRCLRQTW